MTDDAMSTVSLLNNLTDAIASATAALPTDETKLLPPTDGISLLDIKNDLLLSYLQNLVFLILLRLRNAREGTNQGVTTNSADVYDQVVKKLIESRVFIERGVRPLEGKLQYQIDKVLRAAEDAERAANQKSKIESEGKRRSKSTKVRNSDDNSDVSNEDSGSEEDGSEASEQEDFDDEMQEKMHRPNAAAYMLDAKKDRQGQSSQSSSRTQTGSSGVYKPPRITPTAMPLPASHRDRDRDADMPARRRKSNLVDEYIDEEMSTAPMAQPSIGSNSTILNRGRSGLSARDRQKEKERTEYEETNYTRLPAESKAERRKAKSRGERERRDMFGGEDWTGLGGLGDRINRTVSGGKGATSVLQRREKRKQFTEDGPRGDGGGGSGIGEVFNRRKQVLDDRAERKRRKRG